MFSFDNLVLPTSATSVKSTTKFQGKPHQSLYGLLIPSIDPAYPFLPVTMVVPGESELADVGSLVRAVGDLRPGRRVDGSCLTIVSSPAGTQDIIKVAKEIPIPSMSLGGPVEKVWFDAFGDVNLLIEAGKKIASWKVRVSLRSFTQSAQDIFLGLYPRGAVVSATVAYHRVQGRSVVFTAWSIDITYPDNPWLPLKPGVNPRYASFQEGVDEA